LSPATFYKLKAKYGGMELSDAKWLKQLEDENARLKRLLADAMLDRANEAPLMEWMAPAPGIAMCHIGCCHTNL
jgi:putative transposase